MSKYYKLLWAALALAAAVAHSDTLRIAPSASSPSPTRSREVLLPRGSKTAGRAPAYWGNTGIVFAALKSGSIDLYPEYNRHDSAKENPQARRHARVES